MKKILFLLSILLVILAVSACVSLPRPTSPLTSEQLLIRNVSVVDVESFQILSARDVIIKHGKIAAITATQSDRAFNGSIIDGSGLFLTPGFWDSHVVLNQLSPSLDYPLFIANGITSIRSILNCPNAEETSLYPCLDTKYQWNQAVLSNELVGPYIHGSGTFPVNGSDSMHPDSPSFHGVANTQQAQQIVEFYTSKEKHLRPFFIKNYNWVEEEAYLAMVKLATENQIYISGHMPRKVGLEKAIMAGQRSFAHARLFLFECSSYAEELRNGQHWDKPLAEFYQFLLDSYSEEKCSDKYRLFENNQVYLSPILMTRRNDYWAVAGLEKQNNGLQYIHYMFQREWQEDLENLKQSVNSDKAIDTLKAFYLKSTQTIAEAKNHGAKIMAGTDTYDIFVVPGFSLHEELELLTIAGLSNFEALRAATLTPAEYFNIESTTGSIRVGKNADLVLLTKNPVEDIRHTRAINKVIQAGKIFHRKDLDSLLTHSQEMASSHQVTLKLIGLFLQNPGGF